MFNNNFIFSLFVGQQGFFGIATDLALKLTKKAAQKYLYKINLESEQNQGQILNLIQKMKALYAHDINSIEMTVSSKGSQILIDSNQAVLIDYIEESFEYFRYKQYLNRKLSI